MTKNSKRAMIIAILVVLMLIGVFFLVVWIRHTMEYVSTDDAQVRGNLVGLSSKVAARVIYLGADEGDSVKKDEVLARLDNRDLKAVLAQSEAAARAAAIDETHQANVISIQQSEAHHRIDIAGETLISSQRQAAVAQQQLAMEKETAQAGVLRQHASLKSAEAMAAQAKANSAEANLDAERIDKLFEKGAVARQAKDQADTRKVVGSEAFKSAQENVRQQKRMLDVAYSNLRTIRMRELQYGTAQNLVASSGMNIDIAHLESKRIEVERQNLKILAARRNEADERVKYNRTVLAETVVHSPFEGTVAKRAINMGEIATPGAPLFYVIDLSNIWVTANIDEGKIRKIKPGDSVSIHVDAYPGRVFKGKVEFAGPAASSEFSLFPSDNPSGNFIKVAHRIPVRISVPNEEKLLKPGMNVEVDIEMRK